MQFFFHTRFVDFPMAKNVDQAVDSSWKKLGPKLESVLTEGLTVMAKEKPTGNVYEAIQFLGQWLLENNPNNPKGAQVEIVDVSVLGNAVPHSTTTR